MGEVVLSKCKKEDIDVGPLLAEALGVRWAVQVVIEQGINSVAIHSDAANVVNCINRKSSFATINMVVQDYRELMSSLSNVCILFISRDQNFDAHSLASLAKVVGNRTWIGVLSNSSFSFSVMHISANCNRTSCLTATIN